MRKLAYAKQWHTVVRNADCFEQRRREIYLKI